MNIKMKRKEEKKRKIKIPSNNILSPLTPILACTVIYSVFHTKKEPTFLDITVDSRHNKLINWDQRNLLVITKPCYIRVTKTIHYRGNLKLGTAKITLL